MLLFICSENTSLHVSACDNFLDITVLDDGAENLSALFQLFGISLLPIMNQCLQQSSEQTYHLRLPLKEVIKDGNVSNVSANGCITNVELLQATPFYCRCRKCGAVILDQHL